MPCYWGQAEPGLCCGGGCGDAHGKSHKQAGGRGWQGASPSTEVGKGDWNKHMRFCASGKEGVGNAAPRGVENRWLFSPESAAALRHQFSSVAQSCLTLCDPMNRSTPGLPVHHQLPEFTQTHVHPVGDAIQPSHPLSSPSPPAPNPSQHQSLFQ